MSYTTDQAQAIREWILERMTSIIDNNMEPLYSKITREAEALSAYDVCEPGDGAHDECEPDHPCCGMGDWPDFHEVGTVARDIIEGELEEALEDHPQLLIMIKDVLDMHDSAWVTMLGDHYYPDDAKVRAQQTGFTLS